VPSSLAWCGTMLVVAGLLSVVIGGGCVCLVGMLREEVLVRLDVLNGLSAFLKGAKMFDFTAIGLGDRRLHAESVLGQVHGRYLIDRFLLSGIRHVCQCVRKSRLISTCHLLTNQLGVLETKVRLVLA